MEDENKEFFENLNKMTKQEVVDYIYNYWAGLKTEAHNRMKNKDAYMQEEFGRILSTQAIKMRNILTIKSNSL